MYGPYDRTHQTHYARKDVRTLQIYFSTQIEHIVSADTTTLRTTVASTM